MPESIISDRDPIFTSRFWRELFHQTDTQLRMSTAYHPETDGQTERVNQCMETFLRCFVHSCPKKWSSWLALAEYWYNTAWHSALGKSPFHVLYGHEPRHWGIEAASATPVTELNSWLEERQDMSALIRLHLLRARNRMKNQADKRRSERSFSVGDQVFVKLQPYVQSSVARRACHKLSFRYYGPYPVLERIGQVAYKVKLPDTSTIYPVFHVSLLRKALKDNTQVSTVLPTDTNQFVIPAQILDQRRKARANRVLDQVLVRWSGGTLPDSWENKDEMIQRFPFAAAWGQAIPEGEGGVNTSTTTEPQAHEEEGPAQEVARRTSSRARRPSCRVTGNSWTR